VNYSLQIYRVNDGAVSAISAVFQKAAPFPFSANYGTAAALALAAVPEGQYATCLAEGLFRLNTLVNGAITANVTEGGAPSARTAAQIINRIALAAGLTASEISAADVAALDVAQSAEVGIYIDEGMTAREAINQVAESIGAYAVFDISGLLRVGRLVEPLGTPTLSLSDSQMLTLARQSQRDGDLPNFEVRLNHTRNWTPQDSDLAGSVSLDRQEFLKNAWRTAFAEDPSVKLKYLLSPTLDADSLIYDPTNLPGGPADLEAERLLNLYKVRRDIYEVVVHTDTLGRLGVPSLMSLVQLTTPRYGMGAGKLFWLIGFGLELKQSRAILTLWG
jgi:hypothetical protein